MPPHLYFANSFKVYLLAFNTFYHFRWKYYSETFFNSWHSVKKYSHQKSGKRRKKRYSPNSVILDENSPNSVFLDENSPNSIF